MEMRGPMKWVFFMCYIFGHIITSHSNNGFIQAKSLSKFDDLEIEKKLKTINKPAFEIIKSIDGERYGCVDFFKQPAFDHPSMKDHKYNSEMLTIWKGMKERKTNNTYGYLWENGVGCPIGTVPIRRVTKEDILALDSLEDDQYKPRGSWDNTTLAPNNVVHYDQHHYAVGRTKDVGMRFNGATMDLCITAPKVRPYQYSAARLHIQMGDDFIQVGLTVNPVLYKDNRPRSFVYTKAGGTSCYNTHCNVGMISVRSDFPLGSEARPVSIRATRISHFVTFGLIKDQANGNWWLQVGANAEQVGFWPGNRFRQSYGNKVEWGGEVYNANLPGPQMGYGYGPEMKLTYDAYFKRISVLDGNFHVDRQVTYLETFSDDTHHYGVRGLRQFDHADRGHVIVYGGDGA